MIHGTSLFSFSDIMMFLYLYSSQFQKLAIVLLIFADITLSLLAIEINGIVAMHKILSLVVVKYPQPICIHH